MTGLRLWAASQAPNATSGLEAFSTYSTGSRVKIRTGIVHHEDLRSELDRHLCCFGGKFKFACWVSGQAVSQSAEQACFCASE